MISLYKIPINEPKPQMFPHNSQKQDQEQILEESSYPANVDQAADTSKISLEELKGEKERQS